MSEVWALTGGIGSGKSTVRGTLGELGAVTIDADRIGHAVLEPGGGAHTAVAARWPSVVSDGRIDRAALGAIVFADEDALRELEALTHPVIAAEISRQVQEADQRIAVVEVSVPRDLLGVGWQRTIVADLPTDVRRDRLLARGMEAADIDRRMANQPSREGWVAVGRWTVSTAGTRAEVAARVVNLWDTVIARGR